METVGMKVIAHIRTEFPEKFGIPRQSGLVPDLVGTVVFEPEFRRDEALRGIEGFSHLWLLWQFSEAVREEWSPTVRPPRLGGNTRLGVFATRSPYRPNAIGLSAVRLLGIERDTPDGTVLRVAGADLLDGTPIFDIKPYLPFADCLPDAVGGFASERPAAALSVVIPDEWAGKIPPERMAALRAVLAGDPRPRYQHDPERVYGMGFAGLDVRFRVDGDTLTVCGVAPL